jgi:hypothetical protein
MFMPMEACYKEMPKEWRKNTSLPLMVNFWEYFVTEPAEMTRANGVTDISAKTRLVKAPLRRTVM